MHTIGVQSVRLLKVCYGLSVGDQVDNYQLVERHYNVIIIIYNLLAVIVHNS